MEWRFPIWILPDAGAWKRAMEARLLFPFSLPASELGAERNQGNSQETMVASVNDHGEGRIARLFDPGARISAPGASGTGLGPQLRAGNPSGQSCGGERGRRGLGIPIHGDRSQSAAIFSQSAGSSSRAEAARLKPVPSSAVVPCSPAL